MRTVYLSLLFFLSIVVAQLAAYEYDAGDLLGPRELDLEPGWKLRQIKRDAIANILDGIDVLDNNDAILTRRDAMNAEGAGRDMMDGIVNMITIAKTGCPSKAIRNGLRDYRECMACKKAKEAEPKKQKREARGGGGGGRARGGGKAGGGGGAKAGDPKNDGKKKPTFSMGSDKFEADCSLYNM